MKNAYRLKDNTPVSVRDLTKNDIDLSLKFFTSIPESERRYLRKNITERAHAEKRIHSSTPEKMIRRIIILEDQIIADGSLEILSDEWKEGTGYMRLVIHGKFRNLGAGHILASNLCDAAYDNNLNRITTKLMRPQTNLMSLYEELGFKHEGLLPNYVIDRLGKEQDMVIMVCSLEDLRNAHAFIGDWVEGGHTSIGAGEM